MIQENSKEFKRNKINSSVTNPSFYNNNENIKRKNSRRPFPTPF